MSGGGGDLISVIVPSVRSKTIAATIDAIRAQTDADWELVISDQSGNDSLLPILEQFGDGRIRRVACPGRGASMARNVGILHSRGDLLAFTDDDCRPTPDWLARIRALFREEPDLWMATGSILPPPNLPSGICECPSYVPPERRGRASELSPRLYSVTANAAYRREAFTKAGPFDICLSPGTPFCGGEEDDHGQRMERFDPIFLSTPTLEVEHTYGVRQGAKAVWRIRRNYAVSIGGVAGKRTLLGEPEGAEMVASEERALHAALRRPYSPAWLRALIRVRYIREGYQMLLDGYTLNREKRLLLPKGSDSLTDLYAPILPLLDYELPATPTKSGASSSESAANVTAGARAAA